MSTTKGSTPTVGLDPSALRDEELDAVTGGYTVASEAELKNDSNSARRGLRIGDPLDPVEVAKGLKR